MSLPFPEAPAPEPLADETGRRLFAGEVEFLKGVVAMSGLPPADRPEICFAGRSNVGKSSLINALTGRKNLARASNTPGRTQEVNFFTLTDSHYLVDLPGYGFANAPVAVVAKWQALLKDYLAGRANLRRAFLLVDGRHGAKAGGRGDHGPARPRRRAIPGGADQVGQGEGTGSRGNALPRTRATLAKHPAAFPELVVTSSEKGLGLPTLRATIAGIG